MGLRYLPFLACMRVRPLCHGLASSLLLCVYMVWPCALYTACFLRWKR